MVYVFLTDIIIVVQFVVWTIVMTLIFIITLLCMVCVTVVYSGMNK